MAKKTYYFPHDHGARNDPKMQMLLAEHGVAGIGIYWCVIEQLYEQGGKLPVSSYKSIAFVLHIDTNVLQNIIECSGLFNNDGNEFWSEAVNSRIGKQKDVSEQRKKAIATRWKSKEEYKCNTNVIQNDTNKIKRNKIKEKEIDNNIIDDVGINARTREEEFLYDMMNNQSWLESMAMRFKLSIAEIIKKVQEFEIDLQCTATTHNNDAEAKKHFNNWLRIQLQQQTKQNNGTTKSKSNNFTDDELLNAIAQGWERGERELQREQI